MASNHRDLLLDTSIAAVKTFRDLFAELGAIVPGHLAGRQHHGGI